MNKSLLSIDFLTDFFKSNDFKKSGKSWYKKNEHTYILCQYQKSSFSDNFYLNFGIAFIGLLPTSKTPLKSDDWHFDGRYEQILGDTKFIIQIDSCINEQQLKDLLSNITNNVQKFVLPYLFLWSNIEHLKKNFPKDFDHNKLWIKNIKTKNLESFLKTL